MISAGPDGPAQIHLRQGLSCGRPHPPADAPTV